MIPFMLTMVQKASTVLTPPLSSTDITLLSSIFAQFRFNKNTPVNEISDTEAVLYGTDVVTGNKLVQTGSNRANRMLASRAFWFNSVEDFAIQLKFRFTEVGSGGGMLLGCWNQGGAAGNGWGISLLNTRELLLAWSPDGVNSSTLSINNGTPLLANTDYHVIFERASGVGRAYINNFAAPVWSNNFNGNAHHAAVPLATSIAANIPTHYVNGSIWDIRLLKGTSIVSAGLPLNPSELPIDYWSEAEESSIVAQYDNRRGIPVCWKQGKLATLTSATFEGEVIRTTASNGSRVVYNAPRFEGADFTIRCVCKIDSVQTNGSAILARWDVTTSNNNGWLIYLMPNGSMSFMYSINGSQYVSIAAPAGSFVFSRENEVIVERHSGNIRVVVNGVVVASATGVTQPLFNTTVQVATYWNDSTHFAAGYRTGIVMASSALYAGDFTKHRRVSGTKRLKNSPAHIVTEDGHWFNAATKATSTLFITGYANNSNGYNIGALANKPILYFRDNENKVYELKSLYRQHNSSAVLWYVVITYVQVAANTVPDVSALPLMQLGIRLFKDNYFTFASATTGTTAEGHTRRYWSINSALYAQMGGHTSLTSILADFY